MTFLDQLADHILKLPFPTDRIAVVMANRRAEIFLKKALGKHSDRPMIAPRMFPVETFIEDLGGWRVQGQTSLIFLLYQAYSERMGNKADPFDQFLKWANWVLQDFNEIDRYLVDARKVYRNLEDIKVLESWGLQPNEEPRGLMKNYMEFWHQLPDLYFHFRELLIQRGWAYQGMAYRKASEEIDSSMETILESMKVDHIIFAGFNAMNTAEERIVTKFLSAGKAEMLWDGDHYYVDDPDQEAGQFIRQFQRRWPAFSREGLRWVGDHFKEAPKQIQMIGINGQIAQAKLAGQIIGELPTDPDERTALVLADEALLLPVIQSLPPDLPPSNITMGIALTHLPMAAGISALLDMHERALNNPRVKRGNPQAFYYRDLEAFLQTELGRFSVGGIHISRQILESLRKNNLIYLTDKELLDRFNVSPHAHLAFQHVSKPIELGRNLVELINRMAAEKKGDMGSINIESLFALYSLLNRLTDLLEQYPVVQDLRTFRMLYHNLLKDETLSFYGEPLSGLQVLGVLETRNLDFDTLIITSLNEGVLPAGKAHNSFIPYDLKRDAGLPTHEEKDAIYAYHFYRLIQRAKKVFFVYNTNQDTTGGGEKSRFLTQLEMEYPEKTGYRILPPMLLSGTANSDSLRTSNPVRKGLDMEPALRQLAERGISPSAINTYLMDPMEFYQRYVLRLREEEEAEEVAGFDTLGNVVHDVLEGCYKPYVGSFPSKETLQNWIADAGSMTAEAFEKHYPNGNIKEGKNHLIFQVATRMVRDFFDSEHRQMKEGVPVILSLEKELKTKVVVPGWEGPVTIKGKADRIDEVNGRIRIIDYKTGKVELKPLKRDMDIWDGTKFKIPIQLLIYQWLYQQETGNADSMGMVFSTRQASRGYQGLNVSDFKDQKELLDWFETILKDKVGEILTLNGVFEDNRLNLA